MRFCRNVCRQATALETLFAMQGSRVQGKAWVATASMHASREGDILYDCDTGCRLNLNTPPHTPLLVPFSGCLFQTQPLPRSYSCGLGCEVYDLRIPVPMMWVEGCGLLQTTLQQRVADASILSLSSSRPSWGTFIHVGADLGCCIAFVLQERNPTVS